MVDLEAELDGLLREAGWAGMSWNALSRRYAKLATVDDLKIALDRLIARKSIYRFSRPLGRGRDCRGVSRIYYSYWPGTTLRTQSRNELIEATGA
jgi:hypothetical protein